jgi:hypothetical protein
MLCCIMRRCVVVPAAFVDVCVAFHNFLMSDFRAQGQACFYR